MRGEEFKPIGEGEVNLVLRLRRRGELAYDV